MPLSPCSLEQGRNILGPPFLQRPLAASKFKPVACHYLANNRYAHAVEDLGLQEHKDIQK
jgi:hypothetical protein